MSGKNNHINDNNRSAIFVQINRTILDRINKNLQSSDIEEGGKLLGNIKDEGNNLLINVETYIDSGPQVDSSSSHLHPDGIYQEAMFRLIERYDSKIEHIGSWHSHHCNGLNELSQGDINGYYSSVNNPNYNLNFFIAILITKASLTGCRYKTFLFVRNAREIIEIEASSIRVIPRTYRYDELLLTGEGLSLKNRMQDIRPATNFGFAQSIENTANRIRVEDNNWFKENCSFVSTKRDKRDGTICWEWHESYRGIDLLFRYRHLKTFGVFSRKAELEALHSDIVILTAKVSLSDQRHNKIQDFINDAKLEVEKSFGDL